MFSTLVTWYLFLGGVGGGALAVLGVLELAARTVIPSDLFARAWSVCVVSLGLGILCLFADLGRPDRIFNLVLSPVPSAITLGAWALVAALVLAASFAAFALFDNLEPSTSVHCVLAGLACVVGIVVAVYTGVLLQQMASVLMYQTPFLPALFATASLSCGIAVVFLAAAFTETRIIYDSVILVLARIDGLVIAIEASLLFALVIGACTNTDAAVTASALLNGQLAWAFWGCVVVLGLALPFILECFLSWGNHRLQLLWAAGSILVGGFMLRWCIVAASAFDVTQMASASFGLAL